MQTALTRTGSAAALPTRATTDAHVIALWLHGKSPNTQEAYRRDVAGFLAQLPGGLRSCTLEDVQAFADRLGDQDLAAASRNRKLAAVKSLLTFGHQTGYLSFNVGAAVRLPKVRNRLAERILPEADVLRMIHQATKPRDYALLMVLYSTGARVSELAGLRWRDCQERKEGGQLTLFGKGERTRTVLIGRATWQALLDLQNFASADKHVFRGQRGPLTRKGLWDVVKRACKEAGITDAVSPHWLRHAAASHALDRGAPVHVVQQTLGHASLATTSRYTHARPTDGLAQYLPV